MERRDTEHEGLVPLECSYNGYRWNADRTALLIEESQAAMVRAIFTDLAHGASLRRVAESLTRQGFALPGSKDVGYNL